jgi:hypothetical protein
MARLARISYSLLILIILATGRTEAQVTPPASVTGHVIAEIITVLSAYETSQLNFGRFAPGPEGGEIILTPESTISVLGTVFKGPGAPNAASFHVSGDADAAFSISLPGAPVILTHSSDAKTMAVEDFVSVPSPGVGTGMLQNGFQVVYVGATLKVGPLHDNPVGIYTGTYTITFDFN